VAFDDLQVSVKTFEDQVGTTDGRIKDKMVRDGCF
jgi:hypothetical protein